MSERLTLVVFKDHLSSRTLTVRLAWLRAFGLAILSVIGLAIIAGSLFLNAYRKTLSTSSFGDSQRAAEMEKELAEIKASYESLKEQAISAAGGAGTLGGSASSFSSLPADAVLEPLPPRETLPFRLETIRASWKGSTLQIRSAIEYSREDGGNQQGHFILVARGPQSIYAYPEGTFNASGSPALLKPDAGEFFSVSRYREVKADFGPFSKRDDVQNIEIYVFDNRKRLIYFERVTVESASSKSESRTAPATHLSAPSPSVEKVTPPPAQPVTAKPAPRAVVTPAASPTVAPTAASTPPSSSETEGASE